MRIKLRIVAVSFRRVTRASQRAAPFLLLEITTPVTWLDPDAAPNNSLSPRNRPTCMGY